MSVVVLHIYSEPSWSEETCGGPLPPCGALQTVLTEIRAWLDVHPREVVILSFSHFLGLNQELHMLLITAIRAAFATKLCPKTVRPVVSGTAAAAVDKLFDSYAYFSVFTVKLGAPRSNLAYLQQLTERTNL